MNTKITILSLELQSFANKNTGEVNEMTKITYGIDLTSSDKFVGYTIMTSYAKGSSFQKLSRLLKKELIATIELKPGDKQNSVKYVITKINDESIK